MAETRVVQTKAGARHAAERVYDKTGRVRTACGRVVFGELLARDSLGRYPLSCSICASKERHQTHLSGRERERLIELIDLLNDLSVTQLDTDEQAEFAALMAELTDG